MNDGARFQTGERAPLSANALIPLAWGSAAPASEPAGRFGRLAFDQAARVYGWFGQASGPAGWVSGPASVRDASFTSLDE